MAPPSVGTGCIPWEGFINLRLTGGPVPKVVVETFGCAPRYKRALGGGAPIGLRDINGSIESRFSPVPQKCSLKSFLDIRRLPWRQGGVPLG